MAQKKIVVVGSTGHTGKEIIKSLLNIHANDSTNDNLSIVGITRNPKSQKCVESIADNVDNKSRHSLSYVKCDISKGRKEIITAFTGAWGVYIMANLHFFGSEKEVHETKDCVDAAIACGVKFCVFGSIVSCDSAANVPHFHSKYLIEQYLREKGDKFESGFAILRYASFMEGFFENGLKPNNGYYQHPCKASTKIQMVSCVDIGKIVANNFEKPQLSQTYNENIFDVVGDKRSFKEIAEILSAVSGTKIEYARGPLIFRLFLGMTFLPVVHSLNMMFDFFDHEGFKGNMEGCKEKYPDTLDFKQFAEIHFKNDDSMGYSYKKTIIRTTIATTCVVGGGIGAYYYFKYKSLPGVKWIQNMTFWR